MAKQPMASLSASLLKPAAPATVIPVGAAAASPLASNPAKKPAAGKPVAQTVKLDPALFVELKSFSAARRMTHQAIFVDALREYLHRHGESR